MLSRKLYNVSVWTFEPQYNNLAVLDPEALRCLQATKNLISQIKKNRNFRDISWF